MHPRTKFINFSIMWQQSLITLAVTVASTVFLQAFYNIYLHPLSKFPGPWYAVSFSLSGAVISYLKIERQWIQGIVKKYGSKSGSNFLSMSTY